MLFNYSTKIYGIFCVLISRAKKKHNRKFSKYKNELER